MGSPKLQTEDTRRGALMVNSILPTSQQGFNLQKCSLMARKLELIGSYEKFVTACHIVCIGN